MYRVTVCVCTMLMSAGYCAHHVREALDRLSIPASRHGEIAALNCDRDCRQAKVDRKRLDRLVRAASKR